MQSYIAYSTSTKASYCHKVLQVIYILIIDSLGFLGVSYYFTKGTKVDLYRQQIIKVHLPNCDS